MSASSQHPSPPHGGQQPSQLNQQDVQYREERREEQQLQDMQDHAAAPMHRVSSVGSHGQLMALPHYMQKTENRNHKLEAVAQGHKAQHDAELAHERAQRETWQREHPHDAHDPSQFQHHVNFKQHDQHGAQHGPQYGQYSPSNGGQPPPQNDQQDVQYRDEHHFHEREADDGEEEALGGGRTTFASIQQPQHAGSVLQKEGVSGASLLAGLSNSTGRMDAISPSSSGEVAAGEIDAREEGTRDANAAAHEEQQHSSHHHLDHLSSPHHHQHHHQQPQQQEMDEFRRQQEQDQQEARELKEQQEQRWHEYQAEEETWHKQQQQGQEATLINPREHEAKLTRKHSMSNRHQQDYGSSSTSLREEEELRYQQQEQEQQHPHEQASRRNQLTRKNSMSNRHQQDLGSPTMSLRGPHTDARYPSSPHAETRGLQRLPASSATEDLPESHGADGRGATARNAQMEAAKANLAMGGERKRSLRRDAGPDNEQGEINSPAAPHSTHVARRSTSTSTIAGAAVAGEGGERDGAEDEEGRSVLRKEGVSGASLLAGLNTGAQPGLPGISTAQLNKVPSIDERLQQQYFNKSNAPRTAAAAAAQHDAPAMISGRNVSKSGENWSLRTGSVVPPPPVVIPAAAKDVARLLSNSNEARRISDESLSSPAGLPPPPPSQEPPVNRANRVQSAARLQHSLNEKYEQLGSPRVNVNAADGAVLDGGLWSNPADAATGRHDDSSSYDESVSSIHSSPTLSPLAEPDASPPPAIPIVAGVSVPVAQQQEQQQYRDESSNGVSYASNGVSYASPPRNAPMQQQQQQQHQQHQQYTEASYTHATAPPSSAQMKNSPHVEKLLALAGESNVTGEQSMQLRAAVYEAQQGDCNRLCGLFLGICESSGKLKKDNIVLQSRLGELSEQLVRSPFLPPYSYAYDHSFAHVMCST